VNKELSQLFLATPVPDELEAQRRAWHVVQTAYGEREPLRRPRRKLAPLVAFALLTAAIVAVAVPSVRGWIGERVDQDRATQPALVRLPAPGRLLVVSEQGPWVVRADGSKRRLGDYTDASWSPQGLYVVVAAGRRLAAVEPGDGSVRWSLSRAEPIRDPRWSGGGLDTRIAYRTGDQLRVVAGDGSPDRLVARGVAPVASAWAPGDGHVLAYARPDGSVRVVDVDTGRALWHTRGGPPVRQLLWSRRSLLVMTSRQGVLYGTQRRGESMIQLPRGHALLDATFGPTGDLVYTEFDRKTQETAVVRNSVCTRPGKCLLVGPHAIFRGSGRLSDIAWSPDGRWLLVGYPDADQFLFLRVVGVRRVIPVSGIRREFDPGREEFGNPFPRLVAWCCT
jgi:WD40 repeat protein